MNTVLHDGFLQIAKITRVKVNRDFWLTLYISNFWQENFCLNVKYKDGSRVYFYYVMITSVNLIGVREMKLNLVGMKNGSFKSKANLKY
jgi:hypothetical protein